MIHQTGLLSEELQGRRMSLVDKPMRDLLPEDEKKAHGQIKIEMEHGAGTGLLSEELRERRMSLANRPMRDLTAAAAAEPPTPREATAPRDVDLDVDLKASAPQKGIKKTDHVMDRVALHGTEDVSLTTFASLTPEWKRATVLLREMLAQLHPGPLSLEMTEHAPPEEAYVRVLAVCRRSTKKPEMPAGKHESAANTEKRRSVQREGRCLSLILPQVTKDIISLIYNCWRLASRLVPAPRPTQPLAGSGTPRGRDRRLPRARQGGIECPLLWLLYTPHLTTRPT